MKRAFIFLVILPLILTLTACGKKETASQTDVMSPAPTAAVLQPTDETPMPEDIETGNTTIHEGGTKIDSEEIISFSLVYDLMGFYDEDNERYNICRTGRYSINLDADEEGMAKCSLHYKESNDYDGEEIQLDFTAEPEAFTELQQVLTDAGILAINGFYGWDSALGTYVNLDAEYATGEKLSVYGEGGASAYPPADIDAVIVFFNELAESNGLRFTRYSGKTELTALFKEWLWEILPASVDLEDEAAAWSYEEYSDSADLSVGFNDSEAPGLSWGAYVNYDRQSDERLEGFYYYPGISEKDEMMNSFLVWIRENCPGAEEKEGELILTNVNFEGTTDSVQLTACDSKDSELWEIYAGFDRKEKTVSGISFYRVNEEGKAEETVYDEVLQIR